MPEKRKHERSKKSQLGQFFTPPALAERIVKSLIHSPLPFNRYSRVLEPGCGIGSFIRALMMFCPIENIYGIELDQEIFNSIPICGPNLYCGDFLLHDFDTRFDFIVGNPPFGGTINLEHQDRLEKLYGRRGDKKQWKIKKESYSFFFVKSVDLLKPGGTIKFICSDTFLTIKTMSGLRQFLLSEGTCHIERLDYFSEETNYPMVVVTFHKTGPSDQITLDGVVVRREQMEMTGNFSWTMTPTATKYFDGPKIGDYMFCTSGMTTGKNEYFVRPIEYGKVVEPYEFEFFQEPITLKRELEKARLNKLSEGLQEEIGLRESRGETIRNVRIVERNVPVSIQLPHPDYVFYNKAGKTPIYEAPSNVIYWKDDGDAVYTFKKNGNWYLHGVGGKKFFKREGITWSLIATRIKMRYLPPGYILDSGAPCGFLRPGVASDELYFILGWCLSDLANQLLKEFINHTKNIQGKDVERIPYPHWVGISAKSDAIDLVKDLIERRKQGESIDFGHPDLLRLNTLYQ